MTRPWQRLISILALSCVVLSATAGAGEQLNDAINPIMAELVAQDGPGCAVGVAQRGEMLYQRGFGMADLDHDVPITPDTVFRIGSISKQFVAASIAILVLRGDLDLDADVHSLIPELSEYENTITVRHLISHSAGYPDVYEVMDMLGHDEDGNFYQAETLFDIIYGMKRMNFEPGAEFEYSNAGYLLLARIVERVSGVSLRAFAQEQIFGPLGMDHTHFHDNHREIVKNRAYGYRRNAAGEWEERNSMLNVVGDGGVFTTIGDLALWDNNFNQNQLYGGQAFLDLILTPYEYSKKGPQRGDKKMKYAFGLFLSDLEDEPAVWHTGGWAGFIAVLMRFPRPQKSVIILCNHVTEETGQVMQTVATAVEATFE